MQSYAKSMGFGVYHFYNRGKEKMLEITYAVFEKFHAAHPTEANYVLCSYPK